METLGRTIVCMIVAPFIYAFGFFIFAVFASYVATNKLSLGGEWGGNFVMAGIGFVAGGFAGLFIGAAQPSKKSTAIVSGIIATVLLLAITPSLYNSLFL